MSETFSKIFIGFIAGSIIGVILTTAFDEMAFPDNHTKCTARAASAAYLGVKE
jgi:hypothetical protein